MINEFRLKLYLTDHAIYSYYVKGFKYNVPCSSPFRKDSNPSFVIHNKVGKVFWVDYGFPTEKRRDAIGLVEQIYDCTRQQAIESIWQDIVLNKEARLCNKYTSSKSTSTSLKPKIYDYYIHDLKSFELKYWEENFFVTRRYLEFFRVFGLEALYLRNDLVWESSPEDPAFIYLYKDKRIFKAYRPKAKKGQKFKGENNGGIIEGWDQLPKNGEELIIQSSFKDTIVCRRAGYISCNPTGEASLEMILSKAKELNERFKKVFVCFDRDTAGIAASRRLCGKTGWGGIFMGSFKDPSDSVEQTGNYFCLYNEIGKHLSYRYKI